MITWLQTSLAHQHSVPLPQAEGEKDKEEGGKKTQKLDTQMGELIKEDH